MSITYNWIIEQMDSYPEKNNLKNVVFNVHWRVNANEINFNVTRYGTVGVQLDDDSNFTPYSDLTQDQVIGWVKDALGTDQIAQIEEGLAGELKHLITPKTATLELPWGSV